MRVRQACFAYCKSPALTCSKSLPLGGTSEGINGRAGASQSFPLSWLCPHCIFIPQSEKRVSRWGGGGGGVCAACVCEKEGGGGYTVVLFPSALIFGAEL